MAKNKSLKRKAGTQELNDNSKLARSDSPSAIPSGQFSQHLTSQDLSSQSSSSQGPSRRTSCVSCSLDIDCAGDGHFTCDICGDVYHDNCLSDFDPTSLDVVHEVMKVYRWICSECRSLAKTVKTSNIKGKKKSVSAMGMKSGDDTILQRLLNEVSSISLRILNLETIMQDLKVPATSTPLFSRIQVASTTHSSNPVQPNTGLARSGNIVGSDPAGMIISSQDTVTTVHKVMKDADRRKRNIIVSGLRTAKDVDDASLFTSLCEHHFSIKPQMVKCRRIDNNSRSVGAKDETKPSRLLVHLGSENLASEVLSQARQLRYSDDDYVRLNVFISRDMSPEEAKLAFEERVRRRKRKQDSPDPTISHSTKPSSEQLDPDVGTQPSAVVPAFFPHFASAGVPPVNDSSQFPPLPPHNPATVGCSMMPPASSVSHWTYSYPMDSNGAVVNQLGNGLPHVFASNGAMNPSPAQLVSYWPSSAIQSGIHASPFVPPTPLVQPIMHAASVASTTPAVQPGVQTVHLLNTPSSSQSSSFYPSTHLVPPGSALSSNQH